MDLPVQVNYYFHPVISPTLLAAAGQPLPDNELEMLGAFLAEFQIRASQNGLIEERDYLLSEVTPGVLTFADKPGLWVTMGNSPGVGSVPDFRAQAGRIKKAAELGRALADDIAETLEFQQSRSAENPVAPRKPIAIERNEAPSPEQLQRYMGDAEKLIGAVRNLLDAEAWESRPDIELDIGKSLDSIRHELYRPVDDRDQFIIERLTTRLSRYVVEHEQSTADEAQREALENLSDAVLGVFETLDGTSEDAEKIRPAVEELAGNLTWTSIRPPDDVEKGKWANFIEYAEAHPVETLETAFGWRDKAEFAATETSARHVPLSALSGAVTSALVNGLGYGAAAALAVAASSISSVAGMLLTTFAVNFRRATKEPDEN